jgi:hypothetical protein
LTIKDDWDISKFFLDPGWLTVAQVRDPWFRAISMYLDNIGRGYLPDFNSTDINDFLRFINSKVMINGLNKHHTGDIAGYCGMRFLKYDVYIDIDDSTSAFQQLIKIRPDLYSYLNTGWESCTVTNSPSILESKSSSGHEISISGLSTHNYSSKSYIYQKYRVLDAIYCDERTTLAVYNIYYEDYEILKHHLGYKRHECIV